MIGHFGLGKSFVGPALSKIALTEPADPSWPLIPFPEPLRQLANHSTTLLAVPSPFFARILPRDALQRAMRGKSDGQPLESADQVALEARRLFYLLANPKNKESQTPLQLQSPPPITEHTKRQPYGVVEPPSSTSCSGNCAKPLHPMATPAATSFLAGTVAQLSRRLAPRLTGQCWFPAPLPTRKYRPGKGCLESTRSG